MLCLLKSMGTHIDRGRSGFLRIGRLAVSVGRWLGQKTVQGYPYGNILHVLTMDEPHESIVIGARGQVEIDEAREAEHESQSALPFLRFTRLTEADEAPRAFAKLQSRSRPDRSGLIDLMHALNAHIRYQPGSTAVETSASEDR